MNRDARLGALALALAALLSLAGAVYLPVLSLAALAFATAAAAMFVLGPLDRWDDKRTQARFHAELRRAYLSG